jgi:hypothetical protein
VSTAVTLVNVSSESNASGIHVRWYAPGDRIVSASLYRRTTTTDWTLLAHPQPDANHYVAYDDAAVTPGMRYGYRLVVRDATGAETSSAESWATAVAAADAPRVVTLSPVHPNPFGASAQLAYGLPQAGKVQLRVYDIHGRLVATVVDRSEPAGWRSAIWDGRDNAGHQVASGTYLEKLEAGGRVEVRKMVVAR